LVLKESLLDKTILSVERPDMIRIDFNPIFDQFANSKIVRFQGLRHYRIKQLKMAICNFNSLLWFTHLPDGILELSSAVQFTNPILTIPDMYILDNLFSSRNSTLVKLSLYGYLYFTVLGQERFAEALASYNSPLRSFSLYGCT
jgi:hypothetical protein